MKRKIFIFIIILIITSVFILVWALGRDDTDTQKMQGIIVDSAPLTIYTDNIKNDHIFRIDTYDAESSPDLALGKYVSITYSGIMEIGPPVLENISEIEIIGSSSETEYNAALEYYSEYIDKMHE